MPDSKQTLAAIDLERVEEERAVDRNAPTRRLRAHATAPHEAHTRRMCVDGRYAIIAPRRARG